LLAIKQRKNAGRLIASRYFPDLNVEDDSDDSLMRKKRFQMQMKDRIPAA
jgi:hypothetical protein